MSNISNIIPNYNSQNINNQKIDPNDKIQNNLPNNNFQTKNNNNNDELTNINDQCKNTNNNKNTPKIVDVNNIISVNFRSYVLNINYSMPCLKNDLFRACIEKLIVEYPILKDKNIYFLLNWIKVD